MSAGTVFGLRCAAVTPTSLSLQWDAQDCIEYIVAWDFHAGELDIHKEARCKTSAFLVDGLHPSCTYSVRVTGINASGTLSVPTPALRAATSAAAAAAAGPASSSRAAQAASAVVALEDVHLSFDESRTIVEPGMVTVAWSQLGLGGTSLPAGICFEVLACPSPDDAATAASVRRRSRVSISGDSYITAAWSIVLRALAPCQAYDLVVCAINSESERGPPSRPLRVKTVLPSAPKPSSPLFHDDYVQTATATRPVAASHTPAPASPVPAGLAAATAAAAASAFVPVAVAAPAKRVGELAVLERGSNYFRVGWSALDDAASYVVQWQLKGSEIGGSERTSAPHVIIDGLSPRRDYLVSVVPVFVSGLAGEVSETLTVSLAAATPARPSPVQRARPIDVLCTAGESGRVRFFQPTSKCRDCDVRLCPGCLAHCHAGHAIEVSVTFAAFICECSRACSLRVAEP